MDYYVLSVPLAVIVAYWWAQIVVNRSDFSYRDDVIVGPILVAIIFPPISLFFAYRIYKLMFNPPPK